MFPDPPVGLGGVLDESFGLRCWQGAPAPMRAAHRHDDVEVNVVTGGEVVYLFGGRPVRIAAGQTVAFWATMPHQLIDASPEARSHWLTVPMPTVLGWPLPAAARDRLLAAEPVVDHDPAAVAGDDARFAQWQHDLAVGGERQEVALLEMQARLRRLALGAERPPTAAPTTAAWPHAAGTAPRTGDAGPGVTHALTMATFIAHHYDEPITSSDVAAAAHLHPHHAMTSFRRVTGTTIGDYLTRCRVAAAQRMLLTTDLPVSDVGAQAGFTSSSRFYSAFTEVVGSSPGRYRRAARA
ncbi:MAG: helix-turn-helix domain-containing protein [Jatrophihabitans sp.]|uniref:helix-turn-helix domain-containing protein n=1 Tax=Jatrophihabitans sp. TaxID=1932789 RepID=UPI003F81169E